MEMESSRRIFDRSREPGLKKPRLSDESERNQGMNRPFTSAQRPVSNNPMISRFRASERETDSGAGASGRGGGGYQPQPIPAVALQQHQELVSQYRAALAELTFNSKPIITNLTIIAGENVNAAKAIASTICANIIEVPGDMKLPSLYLLDSIVKNIGRDYIKHFAVKLPEVFCKAYRQVEPPIHQSMRHLFGTWKGVFPLHTLQMIEKDLGFTSTINGTPAVSTTPRPDSQASRPSIHVNPKYFERHLQQPTRVKGLSGDVTGSIANSLEDEESLDRATSISSSRSWVDPSAKTHNMQQRPLRGPETIQEKNISAEYADYDYGSDFSRNSGLGVDRPSARVVEQGLEKPWYADGSSLPESLPGQRNSFNTKHGFPNYSAPKSVNSISHLQSAKNMSNRSRGGISSDSWKNSDEEEFRWGDMTTRLTVHGASDVSSNFRKERSTSVDSERSGLEDNIHRPQSMHDYPSRIPKEVSAEPKEFSALPHRVSSPWLSRDSQPVDELSHPGTASFGYPGNGVLGPARAPPHQRLQSPKSELPPLRQHPPLKTEQDRLRTQSLGHSDHKVSQFPEKVNMGIHDPCSHDTPIPPSHTRPSKVVKSQAYEALPSSTIPGIQQKYRYPIPQQVEDSTDSEPLNQTPKLDNFAPDRLNANPVTSIEDPSPSSLLAAVLKSGVLPSLNLQNSGQVSSQKGRSPAPSGPTSLDPRSKVAPSSSKSHSLNGSKSASVKISKKKVETLSPLSLSPLDSVPEKTSKDVKSSPHPISDLLSSLVAKGLISAIKTESPTQIPKKAVASSTEKKKKSPSVIAKTSSVVSSKASTKTVLSKKDDEPSVADPSPKTAVSLPGPVKSEVKSLIGFDFKPDVIRVFHQNVVDDLLEGYEYCCTVCGLRMKLQEQLNRHLELHGTEKTKSRKWFANISDSGGSGLGETYSDSEDEHDKDELMVIADESSCVCVLCGKIFEDFYCQETDEWMFRGATHLMVPPEGKQGSLRKGPIVHAKCISESSLQDLGLATGIKMETDV